MKKIKSAMLVMVTLFTTISASAGKDKPSTIIAKEISINTTIQKAWKVLGPEFANAYKWASSITHSQANDSKTFNGSNCTERGCDVTGIGSIKEKVLEYSDSDHVLSYEVYEGMPKMVKHMTNYWELSSMENGTVKLAMKMEMKTGGFMGWMMNGMMKKKMSKTADQIMEEFKYYVENGNPHPRVAEANKKK